MANVTDSPASSPAESLAHRRPDLQWDVLEEHLDEATFLWAQWERSLSSPDFVLAEVAAGDEVRLLAHLEGLSLAGNVAVHRLLLPALESGEPGRARAAAHVLLASPEPRDAQVFWERLSARDMESGPAMLRAVGLCERVGLDAELSRMLPVLNPDFWPAVFDYLGARGADPGGLLRHVPSDAEPTLLAAVLRAARFTDRSVSKPLIERRLRDARAPVLEAAMETGLVLGFQSVWLRCRQIAESGGPGVTNALLALAMGGDAADLSLLGSALVAPGSREAALWALGFSGQRSAADALLEEVEASGGLAAEAFAAITGMPLAVGAPHAPDMDVDADEEETPGEELVASGLGPPRFPRHVWRVSAIEAWWREARSRFEPGRRYLRGVPWTPEVAFKSLFQEPMHRRAVLAWEMAIRTAGAFHLDTRSWARSQARVLSALRSKALGAVPRSFRSLITR
ncbi:TIGR02270 family protein [Myxococcus sp. AM001]|nr:TIGR02270 family protein [Myxococcus sp. AM001]